MNHEFSLYFKISNSINSTWPSSLTSSTFKSKHLTASLFSSVVVSGHLYVEMHILLQIGFISPLHYGKGTGLILSEIVYIGESRMNFIVGQRVWSRL